MTGPEDRDASNQEWHRRCMVWLGKLEHDLRNQLAPMLMASQMLASGRLDSIRQGEMLDMISRQIQRMVRMLDDLSEFGGLQTGAPSPELSKLDLATLIDAALSRYAERIRASGVLLERQVPEHALTIDGDQETLMQTLVRLIDNALNATPTSGRISIVVSVLGDQVETRVSDTGRGFAPEQLDAIFTLPATPRAGSGLGISLLLARACARRHGGELTGHSDGEARGSSFVLRLPLSMRRP